MISFSEEMVDRHDVNVARYEKMGPPYLLFLGRSKKLVILRHFSLYQFSEAWPDSFGSYYRFVQNRFIDFIDIKIDNYSKFE